MSNEELSNMRDELDTAQEEVVSLTDKLDTTQNLLTIAENKVDLYMDLVNELKRNAAAAPSASAGQKSSDDVDKAFSECTALIKKAVLDGTNLWKAGKKDECGDLYMHTCQEVASKVKSSELRDPLLKCISDNESAPKSKAAVALRKGLDKFLEDKAKVKFYIYFMDQF